MYSLLQKIYLPGIWDLWVYLSLCKALLFNYFSYFFLSVIYLSLTNIFFPSQPTVCPSSHDLCEWPLTLFYLFINFNFGKILQVRGPATPLATFRTPPSTRNEGTIILILFASPSLGLSFVFAWRFHFGQEKYDLVAAFGRADFLQPFSAERRVFAFESRTRNLISPAEHPRRWRTCLSSFASH